MRMPGPEEGAARFSFYGIDRDMKKRMIEP